MKTRICVACQKEFEVYKNKNGGFSKVKTCSKECNSNVMAQHYAKLRVTKRICELCGKEFEPIRKTTGGPSQRKTCSDECAEILTQKNSKKALLEKFGVDNVFKLKEFQDKAADTREELYGERVISKTEYAKEKSKQTSIEKYGVTHHLKLSSQMDKQKQTVRELYGVDNVFQAEEIKKKARNSNYEKYGAEYISQTDHYRENSLKKFGTTHPNKSDSMRKQLSNTHNTVEVKRKTRITIKENIRSGKTKVGVSKMEINVGKKLTHLVPQSNFFGHSCDFYDHSRDLYIELNGVYYHLPDGTDGPRQMNITETHKRDIVKRSTMGDKLLSIYFSDDYTTLDHMCSIIQNYKSGIIASDIYSSKRLDEFNIEHILVEQK